CALGLFGLGAYARAEGALEQEAPECVKVRGEARFQGYGQTHVVIVKNACEEAVRCEVFTDVDPTPRHVMVVQPGKTEELATRQGSPASAFRPGYRCAFR